MEASDLVQAEANDLKLEESIFGMSEKVGNVDFKIYDYGSQSA